MAQAYRPIFDHRPSIDRNTKALTGVPENLARMAKALRYSVSFRAKKSQTPRASEES